MKTNLFFITFLFFFVSCELLDTKEEENTAPTVEIVSPKPNQDFFDYGEVTIRIKINDVEKDISEVEIEWDGQTHTPVLPYNSSDIGMEKDLLIFTAGAQHAYPWENPEKLTVNVTDGGGLTGSAEVMVNAVAEYPEILEFKYNNKGYFYDIKFKTKSKKLLPIDDIYYTLTKEYIEKTSMLYSSGNGFNIIGSDSQYCLLGCGPGEEKENEYFLVRDQIPLYQQDYITTKKLYIWFEGNHFQIMDSVYVE